MKRTPLAPRGRRKLKRGMGGKLPQPLLIYKNTPLVPHVPLSLLHRARAERRQQPNTPTVPCQYSSCDAMASISDEVKAELAAAAAGLREAGLADKVYRDECVVSFTLPQHAGGLYTNLSTFRTYAREYLAADVAASGCKVYLHQHWVKVPKETPSHIEDAAVVSSGGAAKVTDTGAEVYSFEDDWEWRKDYSLHLPASGTTVPYSEADTPEALAKVVKSVLQHDDAFRAAEIASAKVQFETRVRGLAAGLASYPLSRTALAPSLRRPRRRPSTQTRSCMWRALLR